MRQLAWLSIGLCALLLCACPKPEKPQATEADLLPNRGKPSRVLEQVIKRLGSAQSKTLLEDWHVNDWLSSRAHFAGMPQELTNGTQYQYYDYSFMTPTRCTIYTTASGLPAIVECFGEWLATQQGFSVEQLETEFLALQAQHPSELESTPQFARLPEHYVLELDGVVAELARTKPDENGSYTTVLRLALTPARLLELSSETELFPALKQYAKTNTPARLAELGQLLREQGAAGILSRYDFSQFKFDQEAPAAGSKADYLMQTIYLASPDGTSRTLQCGLLALDDGKRACFAFTPEWYTEANGFSAEELEQDFAAIWQPAGGEYLTDGDTPTAQFRFRHAVADGVYLTCKELPTQAGQPRRVLYALGIGNVAGEELTAAQTAAAAWLKPGVGLPANGGGAVERALRMVAETPALQLVPARSLVLNDQQSAYLSGFNQSPGYFAGQYDLDPTADPDQAFTAILLDGRWLWRCSFNDEWLRAYAPVELNQIDSEIRGLVERFQGQHTTSGEKASPIDTFSCDYGRLKLTAVRRLKNGQPTWAFNIENPF